MWTSGGSLLHMMRAVGEDQPPSSKSVHPSLYDGTQAPSTSDCRTYGALSYLVFLSDGMMRDSALDDPWDMLTTFADSLRN